MPETSKVHCSEAHELLLWASEIGEENPIWIPNGKVFDDFLQVHERLCKTLLAILHQWGK